MDVLARGAKHVDMSTALRVIRRRRASFELYTARSVQFVQRESRQLASDDVSRRFFRVVLDYRIYIILAMYSDLPRGLACSG
ncbi:hypothetical protein NEOLEDRAFT_1138361 [Neolentinus lepideus HHB14362 ss-1]|uniref:Uncharacterized protein n=1 Tax=Neolentinus lepideus HHB14362 ss-1 TaxID=1314782 RepID=A0A165QC35_9AGAM|nr:hypothetical protein NEOLEDRAFT_1138361 [Neolentinus lepideus HHB14362 ss-1]